MITTTDEWKRIGRVVAFVVPATVVSGVALAYAQQETIDVGTSRCATPLPAELSASEIAGLTFGVWADWAAMCLRYVTYPVALVLAGSAAWWVLWIRSVRLSYRWTAYGLVALCAAAWMYRNGHPHASGFRFDIWTYQCE